MIFLEKDQALSRLQELVRYHDAPLITISYYIHSLLSKAISENGYRVVLSGTGADEIFTGYYDHFNLHLYEMRERPSFGKYLSDWQEHVYAFVRNPFLRNPEYYFSDPQRREHIVLNSDQFADCLRVGFREDFTETSYCECLLRNRMMNEMFHEATRVILHEDDLNSMMYSVENRSPYLDRRLFDFAFTIPNEHLIRQGYGKYILREAVKDILNDKVRLDRHKKGFNASIHSVLNFRRKQDREYLLDNSNVYEFVDKKKIESIIKRPYLPNSFSKFLFSFINVKMFLEQNG
jgi:asparagine synthase (glutamine-hydrolysing)